jgi:hypothetical protein
LQEAFAEVCLRAIPAINFRSPDAYERFCSELAFWKGLSAQAAVDLYDCGVSGEYYYMLMRYMPEGSVAAQVERDNWLREHVTEVALDLAGVLRDLHASSGAHANLKPSNVFPLRDGGVLLSDFSIPLWIDEFDAGCSELRSRLLHPFRAVEQRDVLRDFDTRSDVYSFALVLLYCLTGLAPGRSGEPPEVAADAWPAGLRGPLMRCLAQERDRRPADGYELSEVLQDALDAAQGKQRPAGVAQKTEMDAGEGPELEEGLPVEGQLRDARQLIEEGLLDEALGILESLPDHAVGVAELLDQIEARQRSCRDLAEEAVRLAGLGNVQAAMETIEQAQTLWAESSTAMAVRGELAAEAVRAGVRAEGGLPEPLHRALAEGKYAVARTLLEKCIREEAVPPETEEALRQFKKGRVRKAFLDSLQSAKRLYVQGHHEEAKAQWLEAARWLPSGAEKQRLRQIAAAATKGSLVVAPESVAPVEGPGLGEAQGAPRSAAAEGQALAGGSQQSAPAGKWKRYVLLAVLALAAAVVVGVLTLLWGVLGG